MRPAPAAPLYAFEMSSEILDGEDIVQARIRGESVRSIARRLSCTLAEVHKILDRFAETTIDDKTRKHSLALELERLDQLQHVFGARALEGDVASGALRLRGRLRRARTDRRGCGAWACCSRLTRATRK
jgi:hypothetical protein